VTVRVLAAVMMVAAGTSACAPDGLAFRIDERVTIVEPEDEQKVQLPLTIDWDVEEFDGSFAVFVDRSPVGPGDELPADLPEGVLSTADTKVVLETMPRASLEKELHTATIVLIDRSNRRVGESAFDVTFELEDQ
jgi:hypothetical protein